MKKFFLYNVILGFILCCSQIIAQDFNNNFYDVNCGFWRTGNSSTNNNQTNSSAPFLWQFVSTPVTSQIVDMIFVDSLYGWCSHTGNGGIRTTNSGATWTSFSFADTTFTTAYNGIYFININTGWCVGGSIQIRKTTNGGLNWFKQYGPPVSGINRSVWFANANTGYIAGSKGFPYQPFLAKTTNGGNNWTEITPSVPTAQELNDMHWLNVTTGWIAGYDVLLYTTNAGASFENRFANVPPTGNGHNSLLSVSFVRQETGWIGAANLERNNIYKTTNGGLNWIFQNNAVSQAGWNQINDIQFMSVFADTGWAVHGTPTTGAIMFTSNGGTNWVMDNTTYSWYDCLEIYNRKKVWSGGSSGRVWWTFVQSIPSGINPISNEIPEKFSLGQNYPNPFNPVTDFEFRIADFGFVKLNIYGIKGSIVATLINQNLNAGAYKINFDANGLNSGVYFYRLETNGFVETRKMILLK
ncbi:MAG TPA: T9SS type A sorting domain-containing protein [Ignavibacteria bacterium]|nr:T9SS type A sorting domain-containing protein [Ignavibacteria bacterium]